MDAEGLMHPNPGVDIMPCILCGEVPEYVVNWGMAFQNESVVCHICKYEVCKPWNEVIQKWNELQLKGKDCVQEYMMEQHLRKEIKAHRLNLYLSSDDHLAKVTTAGREQDRYDAERAEERLKQQRLRVRIGRALYERDGGKMPSFEALLNGFKHKDKDEEEEE